LNFAQTRRLQAAPQPEPLQSAAITSPASGSSPSQASSFVMPILPLSEMEKRAIIQALDYTKGDRVMAAHLLGIGRTTLYRKLKEYGIQV
jgi:transcriptional regulator of acetoin/glycerol metabolism